MTERAPAKDEPREAKHRPEPRDKPRGKPSGGKLISKTVFNFWLDTLLLVLFSALVGVTAIVHFVFPPPAEAAGWTLWGMTFSEWFGLEFGILCALALSILLHVMMHWSWVCGVITTRLARKKRKIDEGMQTIYGVGLLIVIFHVLAFAIAAAVLTIREPPL